MRIGVLLFALEKCWMCFVVTIKNKYWFPHEMLQWENEFMTFRFIELFSSEK